ncbi:MAG: NAD(P)/FAD-dependent oxidoreductase [Thermotoga caldifontis]|uniref:NAD(P)/FAD-dependent oxidoreductase n=1 Tax=Thermotoga caldifontis TaxID=1508419 RepID=UPI003C7A2F9F
MKNIEQYLSKKFSTPIHCEEKNDALFLYGRVDSWDKVVSIGREATKFGFRGVVNKIECEGVRIAGPKVPCVRDQSLHGRRVDVLIIGAGVVGCAIARELSRWKLDILVVDKESDVACHQSSHNAGMMHPPIAPHPKSKKAYYNRKGLDLIEQLARELDFPYRKNGLAMLFPNAAYALLLPFIKFREHRNQVRETQFMSASKLLRIEPHLKRHFAWAYVVWEAGVVDPFQMTLAFAENAVQNGARFSFNTLVESFVIEDERIEAVVTNRGTIFPRLVVNAAGVWADHVAALANDEFFTIHPRKGEMAIIDKKKSHLCQMTISMISLKNVGSVTKGGGLIPTVHGNLLLGPTALEVPQREDYSTSLEGLEELFRKHAVVEDLSKSDVISYFAGTRAATYEEDFIVEPSKKIKNLVHAAGIQSPGLTSAPAIAMDVASMCIEKLQKEKKIVPNERFCPVRKNEPNFRKLSLQEKQKIIEKNPAYGIVICRCETVTRGEVLQALNGEIPATTLDGIKWRTRCGMGRCQGGFCTPFLVEILQQFTDPLSITKKGPGSELFVTRTRPGGNEHDL